MKMINTNEISDIVGYYVVLIMDDPSSEGIAHICERVGHWNQRRVSVTNCNKGLTRPGNLFHPTQGRMNSIKHLESEGFELCPECGDRVAFLNAFDEYVGWEAESRKRTRKLRNE